MKERKSNRLSGFDYSLDNLYYVTCCVQNRICCFGKIVGTGRDLSLPQPLKIKSLSELIGAYKTSVSKQIHISAFKDFSWQRSFYDTIIRDEMSYKRISDYIINNPVNWKNII
jgi:putative transposase